MGIYLATSGDFFDRPRIADWKWPNSKLALVSRPMLSAHVELGTTMHAWRRSHWAMVSANTKVSGNNTFV